MSGRGDLRTFFPVRKGSALAGSSASKKPVPDGSSVITPKSVRSTVPKKPDSGTTGSGSVKNVAKTKMSQTQVRVSEVKSRPSATKESHLPALPSSAPRSQIGTSARSDEKRTPNKTTRAEFLKLRQKIGSAAIAEFHVSCEELQKSPEKLQKSPFYSPHKTQLTTAQATTSIRAGSVRRKLFSDFLPTAEPGQSSNDDGFDSVIQPGEECTAVASGNQEKATPRKRQLSDAKGGLHEYASPQKVLKGTPAKGQPEKEANVGRGLLSPGRKISVFSPAKGHVYETVRTAADVHAEAVCKINPKAVDPDDAFLRRTMEPKDAISTTEESDSSFEERSRALAGLSVSKAFIASKGISKMLHDKSVAKTGVLYGVPNILTRQHPTVRAALKDVSSTKRVSLPLPRKFLELAEIFQCLELSTAHSSTGGSCCFERLRQFMQRKKASLTYECLGRMLAVFPEAYTVRAEKVDSEKVCPEAKMVQRSSVREHYVLRIRDHNKPLTSGTEEPVFVANFPDTSVQQRVYRRIIFNDNLLKLVHRQHTKFLLSRRTPVELPESEVTGWHDAFPLEDVPLPGPVNLPPFSKPTVPVTYEQMKLNVTRDKPMFSSKPRKSTEQSGFHEEILTDKIEVKASDESVFNHRAFKDMGEDTKSRVREAQMKKDLQKVKKDPKVERRKMLLGRLVEMGSILLGHFASEKKERLIEANVKQTMKQSMKHRLSSDEFQEYYDLFVEVFETAKWLKRVCLKDEDLAIVAKTDHRIGLKELEEIVEAEYSKLTDL